MDKKETHLEGIVEKVSRHPSFDSWFYLFLEGRDEIYIHAPDISIKWRTNPDLDQTRAVLEVEYQWDCPDGYYEVTSGIIEGPSEQIYVFQVTLGV